MPTSLLNILAGPNILLCYDPNGNLVIKQVDAKPIQVDSVYSTRYMMGEYFHDIERQA